MEERKPITEELNTVRYDSYPKIFAKFRELSQQYGGLPESALINAFQSVSGFGFGNMYTNNPYVQNKRVKGISTRPADYQKKQVAEFIQHPDNNEKPLRAIAKALEYSAYTLFHTRTVYQNLLTYHSYIAPHLTDKEDAKRDDFWREWKLLEKLRCAVNPKDKAHEFAGLALQQGKVFIYPRISVDRPHNRVNHTYLQQLPTDWCKIVGFNNISKYTIAFDLMYFAQYGTDWRQFGNLFEPYISDFYDALTPAPVLRGKKVVYAKRTGINMATVQRAAAEGVDAYFQNGRWYYWVTLPVDQIFTFEIDDTERNVIPPFIGLFLSLIQLKEMEDIQLELLQNPLVSLLHGEIPYWEDRNSQTDDQYKLSNAGMLLFESLWYQMLDRNNTSGIGLYMAPLTNMKLESLNEVPNATTMISNAYQDLSVESGLAALVPATADARAGAVQVSFLIESQFGKCIYRCFERMMNCIIDKLNLRYEWRFRMFGSLAEDEKTEKELKEQMTLGILPATIEYNALHDRSILDDMAWSDAIVESDLLSRRLPLLTSYTAKQSESGLPPQGGRPRSEGVTSDGQEQDQDSPIEQGSEV